jgi:isopentenyldiphosphate isomerase
MKLDERSGEADVEESLEESVSDGSQAELVDVVDEHDAVIATVPRSVMRCDRLLHRAVYVIVFDPQGRLLIHRRSDRKDIWPGWWDIAIGGVVSAGESWEQAVRREVAEEIGIEIATAAGDAHPEPIGGGRYDDDHLSVLGRCYRIVIGGPVTFADGEIVEAEWVAPGALRDLLGERRFLPDSLALLGGALGLT